MHQTFLAPRPPDIGVAAGSAYVLRLGANTDAGTAFACEHSHVKASHSAALTVGATLAVALPAALGVVAGMLDPSASWSDQLLEYLPELTTPAVCVAAAWLIVRHAPTSPTGPALAWTGGAISFVSTFDVIA